MIHEIVGLICKEARSRKENSLAMDIVSVMFDVNVKVLDVLDVLREEERRKKEDENKDRKKPGSDTG